MKITHIVAVSVLTLSSSVWAAPKGVETHKDIAHICAEANKDLAQANEQYKGKIQMADGTVKRFDSIIVGNEKFRLISGENLENMAVVYHYPGIRALKEDQQFKVKGIITSIETQYGCMVMMESGSTY